MPTKPRTTKKPRAAATKKPRRAAAKKSPAPLISQYKMRLTLLFGYLIFGLIAVNALTLLAAPFINSPWEIPVLSTGYWLAVALVLAELLPLGLGLVVGETVRAHSRLERHYNAILLAVVAHTLAQALNLINVLQFDQSRFEVGLVGHWPIWLTVAMVLTVGLMYYGTRPIRPLVQFRPFQLFAGISTLALLVASLWVFRPGQLSLSDLTLTFTTTILLLAGLGISYWMSHVRSSRAARLADACVGMAWLFASIIVATMIILVTPQYHGSLGPFFEMLPIAGPLVIWLGFIWLANRR